MEAVEKVDSKKQALEEAYERLIGHLREMKRDDFDPLTNPEDMAESAELSSTQRCGEADDTLSIHEDSIKQAEKVLSLQLALESVTPGIPRNVEDKSAPALPIFRAQSDLKPQDLKKSSTYREVVHFCQDMKRKIESPSPW